jgi:hypothetical protein
MAHCCPGDLLCCYGRDAVSRLIRWRTCWPIDPWSRWNPPSHVGIIGLRDRQAVLYESTSLGKRPCLHRGYPVRGVQAQPVQQRVDDYLQAGGYVELYRPQGLHQFRLQDIVRLDEAVKHFLGRGAAYDYRGAFLSGMRLPWLARLSTCTKRLFCSEFVAACLMHVGRLNLQTPGFYSPGRLLRELVRLGIYERVNRWTTAEELALA